MFLGVEIGGTKLQLGVGRGDGRLVALNRFDVRPERGAAGIREQIRAAGPQLIARHNVTAAGFGFGGPVETATGVAVKSHHIQGWDRFPLADWCREELGIPAVIENDCDAAALAEACFGAGRGRNPVLYVTVGTGIGGGLVVDGRIYRGAGHGAAEIGHLRPGLACQDANSNLESLASGWGIAARTRQRLSRNDPGERTEANLLRSRCADNLNMLTTKVVAEAAARGNVVACEVLSEAVQALGWGIAQAITLCAPEAVVVGGGVSMAGEQLFWKPLRQAIDCFVFPPFDEVFQLLPAELEEEVVVHGALAAAKSQF